MIITIKNNSSGTRSYLNGAITVAESSQTIVARDFNVILSQDAQLVSDCITESVILNNGSTDLSGPASLELVKTLSAFSFEPIATSLLYYTAPILIEQSTNTLLGTTVWAMRNPLASVKQVFIEKINLNIGFAGTNPILATTLIYEIIRFDTATPTGGTQITVVPMNSSAPTSAITDVRYLDTGLTVTSVNFGSPLSYISVPAVKGSFGTNKKDGFTVKLAPGEGLAIRLKVDSIAGQSLCGEVVWSER